MIGIGQSFGMEFLKIVGEVVDPLSIQELNDENED
jgi:hypothetical protein